MNLRVLLINEHRIFREAVRFIVEADKGFQVVAEASSAAEALQLVASVETDVVAAALPLPDRSSVKFIREALALRRDAAILVLGGPDYEEHVTMTMKAGARGYVKNDAGRAELVKALRTVAAGNRYPSKSAASARRTCDNPESSGTAVNLTDRQQEVLRSVALGDRNRDIAMRLGVSVKAIQQHRARISELLNLHGTAALTLYAVRTGLITERPLTAENA